VALPAAEPMLTEAVLTEIKTLGRLLGEARDWDVFVGEMLAAAAPSAPLPAGLAAVKRRALAARRQARQAATGAVAAPGYTATMIRLAAALHALARDSDAGPADGSLQQFASDLLALQHGRVLKRGRRLEQLAYPDLHRLRIEVKRLRYAAEFFASVLPGRAKEALRRLARLQDLLGKINDDVNAWALLDRLEAGNADAHYQQAVGYLRGHAACDARHCLAQLPKAWARFEQLRRWW
jgi:CHAD domain-containing protein